MATKTGSAASHFRPEQLSEEDIESIWLNMMKTTGKDAKKTTDRGGKSVDTTPTTDYSGHLFPLHPETLEEDLQQDREIAQMKSVLRSKQLKPKSYLPQVILYDNVSRDRLLTMRLDEIRHAHLVAERRAKRRQETFVKSLQRKQDDWNKRDARVLAKLEPENLSELSFAFGRLYNKPDYPYQAVIQALSSKHPQPRMLDHARRRPIILPQVTNRPIYDDEEDEDKTFVTKLPKVLRNPRAENDDKRHRHHRAKRGREKMEKSREDWTSDARFQTLTDLLGERYSPKKNVRTQEAAKPESFGLISTIL